MVSTERLSSAFWNRDGCVEEGSVWSGSRLTTSRKSRTSVSSPSVRYCAGSKDSSLTSFDAARRPIVGDRTLAASPSASDSANTSGTATISLHNKTSVVHALFLVAVATTWLPWAALATSTAISIRGKGDFFVSSPSTRFCADQRSSQESRSHGPISDMGAIDENAESWQISGYARTLARLCACFSACLGLRIRYVSETDGVALGPPSTWSRTCAGGMSISIDAFFFESLFGDDCNFSISPTCQAATVIRGQRPDQGPELRDPRRHQQQILQKALDGALQLGARRMAQHAEPARQQPRPEGFRPAEQQAVGRRGVAQHGRRLVDGEAQEGERLERLATVAGSVEKRRVVVVEARGVEHHPAVDVDEHVVVLGALRRRPQQ
ncbi:hypothetical protein IF1G_07876 [Cordyceps javanica]|uniref:Uncharacterized protein n=1 Tax=Cordyceps javanica TaxID=43265 RepID=A0A545VUF8_9HYPO|nr:hypothetical protein IF1G_07876 [Cordyceps javanica]TQW05345.1 hypothetical protein IF2G_07282 [Cordyceps javanica]